MPDDETAGSNPVGIAFSLQAESYQAIGAPVRGKGLPTSLDSAQLERSESQPDSNLLTAVFASSLVATRDLSLLSPPVPDPTGLTYVSTSNTLVVSDSEVEETVNGITHFQGANIWEITMDASVIVTGNVSYVPPTVLPFANEPNGIAFNPLIGHYYITDDGTNFIYDLGPGLDGQMWTEDDDLNGFSIGSTDPEGITFDSVNNVVYVADGVNAEIYKFSLDGTLLDQFDVLQYGIVDPNSVEFNPISHTLFIAGNGPSDRIIEVTLNGDLLRPIDLSAIPLISPDGLAYAPASDGSGAYRFYIADRGIDNDINPNIIDGKIYEVTTPPPLTVGNQPIIIDAGLDQFITLPTNMASLDGTVPDDGIPVPVTTIWSQVSGACLVNFGDPTAIDTTATFPYAGRYELNLYASDGELEGSDTTKVEVRRPIPTKNFDSRIEAIWDDAEQTAGGTIRRDRMRIRLGEDDGLQTDGFRFNWLEIPQGATILNAYIQFKANGSSTGPASLTIKGQASDNATTFLSSAYNISSRPTTAASVAWAPNQWLSSGAQGVAQRTPNIASVIQEIVDRPGWISGNSAVIIITGTGTRNVWSYDGDRCGAAYLHIDWDMPENNPPVAVDDSYSTAEDTPMTIATPGVLGNDTDLDSNSLSAIKVSDPSHGTLTLNSDGSFTYTPATDYNGTDTFTYKAFDGAAYSSTVTVTISVQIPLFLPLIFRS